LIKALKKSLRNHLNNIPAYKFNKKIVVFESDDWGSTRMPSQKAFEELKKQGIRADKSHYNSLDALERKSDLEALLGVLQGCKNGHGNHPKFTPNVVLGNPDFEQIKKNKFLDFVHQHFFDSYKFYYNEDLKSLWYRGIKDQTLTPQFHAREHLNVPLWMRDLKKGNQDTLNAFNHFFYGLKTQTSSQFQKHYLAAYHAENFEELQEIQTIIKDGLHQFEKTFGFPSKSFIACNYVWPKQLEPFLKDQGVVYLQGEKGQLSPMLNKAQQEIYHHYTGQKNRNGQIHLVRNGKFDPYLDQNADWVQKTLKDVETAFLWKTPAIISTHRINYVSQMSVKNRDETLKKLNKLLEAIVTKWPEVEFLSSDELGDLINS